MVEIHVESAINATCVPYKGGKCRDHSGSHDIDNPKSQTISIGSEGNFTPAITMELR